MDVDVDGLDVEGLDVEDCEVIGNCKVGGTCIDGPNNCTGHVNGLSKSGDCTQNALKIGITRNE